MRLPAFLRLPSREEILRKRPLGRFTHYLTHSAYWQLKRSNLARAGALGTFIGTLPYFGHELTILILCLVLHRWRRIDVNVPLAMLLPFIVTGPLTIVEVFYASYQLGYWLLQQVHLAPAITIHYADIQRLVHGNMGLLSMGDRLWHAYWVTWIGSIPFGATLAAIVYVGILLGWRGWVNWRLFRRRQNRN
ncbi:DUF2062 domain-containing protein [Acidithiobacillus sp. CV18-2]|uniref:DUF2062 domain-containing protein n=1 Tax=Igneacidithiobacillus copahuensis TaxID=2724909 RepID=A0AAE2YQ94_9PROT|nr:DUF2062 domain-containing protein [Igneacidithiobacillus copahuensis]MBU2755069.1 DUF2062 domain-containing protein [Acidithiobacillus sp. CV18-3]MBU2756630.1 DUF2062 domain-containing protein [Acidithiobacillus sp. BN09-2]MBU2777651.1 DUF2062 domain-containing protein [Acidithiobacillus sp. CV18-2]MBU2796568.1 DUF2062 domain-containing protein [Acidithiobacillus sp. VAN18-2]MBU2800646.1 DUF2062 domain-containing protein [Acidithiobacillus sp. VAN18-4]UTV81247.1 DUF2062 domain-containing p